MNDTAPVAGEMVGIANCAIHSGSLRRVHIQQPIPVRMSTQTFRQSIRTTQDRIITRPMMANALRALATMLDQPEQPDPIAKIIYHNDFEMSGFTRDNEGHIVIVQRLRTTR
jgi:hypothetical protein